VDDRSAQAYAVAGAFLKSIELQEESMRHLTFLLIAIIALVAPANLFAQAGRAAQASKPAQTDKATPISPPVAPVSQITTNQPRADDFYKFVSSQRWGTYLQVRMKSKTLFHGTRAEVNPGYFVLMHRGRTLFIAYKDIASIKTGRTFWQQAGRVVMWPLKGAMYAVIIPVGLGILGFHVLKAKIQGKDPWEDK
jgi:hypothetical protein